MMNEILLFSGGLDSYIAWHKLGKPKTLYINLGTKYSAIEQLVVENLIPGTIIEHFPLLGTREYGPNAYIPFRNVHLAFLAYRFGHIIHIAGLKDDMVNDKNPTAFKKMSTFMSFMMNDTINVSSPFWEMTKEQVVRWYLDNVDSSGQTLLHGTHSCYTPKGTEPCWACPACLRKWIALAANNIRMPEFENWVLMRHYLDRAYKGEFIPERNDTTIRVLNNYFR